MIKGIRGAITVEENSCDSIKDATVELLSELIKKNDIKEENISHIIFTLTHDLNASFPAKFARENIGFTKTAMMCFNEINVPNALAKCLRILIVLNCQDDFEPQFVYLKGAAELRKDLK